MKSKPKIPRKKDFKAFHSKIMIILAVVLAVLVVITYLNFQSVGKAVEIQRGITDYNLVRDGSLVIPILLRGQLSITILTSTSSAATSQYDLVVERKDEQTMNYTLKQHIGDGFVAGDVLFLSPQGDSSLIYLNADDAIPDLEIKTRGQQITITNLHFLVPDSSRISLVDYVSHAPYDSIIYLNQNEDFRGLITASSSSKPSLTVDVTPTIVGLENLAEEGDVATSTFAQISFTAPNENTVFLFNITAQVRNQRTPAYYTVAVGGLVYVLHQEGFPMITLTNGRTAQLNVTFKATTELQPFALPCEFSGTADQLFTNSTIRKVYTYDHDTVRVWNQGDIPDDFNEVLPGHGYFVELRDAAETTITVPCTIKTLPPVIIPQSLGRSERLLRGWNLVSLRGVNSRPLNTLIQDTEYEIYQCSQGNTCTSLTKDTLLEPGKPYWILANSDHISLPQEERSSERGAVR